MYFAFFPEVYVRIYQELKKWNAMKLKMTEENSIYDESNIFFINLQFLNSNDMLYGENLKMLCIPSEKLTIPLN